MIKYITVSKKIYNKKKEISKIYISNTLKQIFQIKTT